MTYTFPSTIKAARISTFISTAAWIQSAAAVPVGDVWLPEEALSNFLSRHTKTARADVAVPAVNNNNGTNPAAPRQGAEEEGDEDEEHDHADGEKDGDEEEGSADSSVGDAESLDSSKSSDSDSGSTAKGEKDGVDALPGGTIDNNTAGGAISASPAQDGGGGTGDPLRDGIAAGGTTTGTSSAPAGLSPGAQAAIAVWVVIGVVAAGVAFWWFRRRRQRQKAAAMQGSGSDTASSFFSFMGGNGGGGGRDPEGARTQPMAAQGAMPSILPTPMDPAAFMNRPLSRLSGNNNNTDYVMRAQPGSGPDYNNNDGIPFGADSQSWRQSPPPGAYSVGGLGLGGNGMTSPGHKRSDSRVGLPSNPRPGSQREMVIGSPMMNGPSYRRGGDQDARTVITDGTESTIFNWR